ncbi:MAG: guanylate kinase, partial [Calditrichaeota bacterium]|nr:guanylate kinase [Calditrichota bacterium]
LLDIDVKGALAVKRIYKDTVLFFIKTPSLEELRKRLISRNTETEEQIETRMNRVKFEYEKAENFDHIIINDNLERAINEIESYIYQ